MSKPRAPMSQLGHERKSNSALPSSAFPSKAEVEPPPTLVRSNLNSGHHAPGLRSPESANRVISRCDKIAEIQAGNSASERNGRPST
jgi:hypothetical protein